jgi:hypothetical protein
MRKGFSIKKKQREEAGWNGEIYWREKVLR